MARNSDLTRQVQVPRRRRGGAGSDILGTATALAVNGGARFVASVLVGRWGGPAALGGLQSALSFAQLAALAGPTSIGAAASAYVAKETVTVDHDNVGAVATYLGRRACQATAGVTGLAVVGWLVGVSQDILGLAAFAILVIVTSLYVFVRGNLYGSGAVSKAVRWDIIGSTVGLSCVAVGVVQGAPVYVYVLCFALNYLLFIAATWPRGRREDPPLAIRREIDKFVLFATLGTIASSGFLQGAVIVARLVGGEHGAGQFAAAFVIATPVTLMSTAMTMLMFPKLAAGAASGAIDRVAYVTDIGARALVVVMVPVFGSVIVLRDLIVKGVWGDEFADASTLLGLMLIALLLNTIAIPAVNSITSRSSVGQRTSALSSSVGVMVGCLSWAILVPEFGLVGLAIGYLVGTVITSVTPFIIAWRWNSQTWAWLTCRIFVGLSLIVACVAAAEALAPAVGVAVLWSIWAAANLFEFRRLGREFRRREARSDSAE